MKKLLILFVLLIPILTYSQEVLTYDEEITDNEEITGQWSWLSENGSNSFELDLIIENGALKGHHCSSFYDGLKIDCVDNTDIFSVNLTKVSLGVYEGTIQSGYSLTRGKIRVSYDKINNSIVFKILEKPQGEFYFPIECTLTQ